MSYFDGQTIPQNRPLIHISQWWGLWSGELSKRSLQNPNSLKMFCSIPQPNVYGFQIIISYFNGTDEGFPASHRDLKSMHAWQQDGVMNVGCVVHETATYFAFCLCRCRPEGNKTSMVQNQHGRGPRGNATWECRWMNEMNECSWETTALVGKHRKKEMLLPTGR